MPVLEQFGDNIWIADGPGVRFALAQLPTRTIVVRLADGSVWVNSPVGASPELLGRITSLGPVRYLVSPTNLHAWRLDEWHARFPDAQLWGFPKAPRVPGGSALSGALSDTPPAAWASDIDQLVFRGNAFIGEVEFFHKASRTLVLADFVQNYLPGDGNVASNALKRIGGVLGGGVPLDIRLSFIHRGLARVALERLLSWDFDKVIVAHGACITWGAKAFVERAFGWLRA